MKRTRRVDGAQRCTCCPYIHSVVPVHKSTSYTTLSGGIACNAGNRENLPYRTGLHDVGTMIVVFIVWVRREVCWTVSAQPPIVHALPRASWRVAMSLSVSHHT